IAYERLGQLHLEKPTAGQVKRLVSSALSQYEETFFAEIYRQLAPETRQSLDHILSPTERDESFDDEITRSVLHHIKGEAGKAGVRGVRELADQLKQIQAIALPDSLFAEMPLGYLRRYQQRVNIEAVSQLQRHPGSIRYPLLAIYCWLR